MMTLTPDPNLVLPTNPSLTLAEPLTSSPTPFCHPYPDLIFTLSDDHEVTSCSEPDISAFISQKSSTVQSLNVLCLRAPTSIKARRSLHGARTMRFR